MGEEAGAPIEPDEQTRLIEGTLGIAGVLAALVPGAGGHDALACVYINTEATRCSVGKFWADWKECTVCALTAQGVDYGQGLRLENNK